MKEKTGVFREPTSLNKERKKTFNGLNPGIRAVSGQLHVMCATTCDEQHGVTSRMQFGDLLQRYQDLNWLMMVMNDGYSVLMLLHRVFSYTCRTKDERVLEIHVRNCSPSYAPLRGFSTHFVHFYPKFFPSSFIILFRCSPWSFYLYSRYIPRLFRSLTYWCFYLQLAIFFFLMVPLLTIWHFWSVKILTSRWTCGYFPGTHTHTYTQDIS